MRAAVCDTRATVTPCFLAVYCGRAGRAWWPVDDRSGTSVGAFLILGVFLPLVALGCDGAAAGARPRRGPGVRDDGPLLLRPARLAHRRSSGFKGALLEAPAARPPLTRACARRLNTLLKLFAFVAVPAAVLTCARLSLGRKPDRPSGSTARRLWLAFVSDGRSPLFAVQALLGSQFQPALHRRLFFGRRSLARGGLLCFAWMYARGRRRRGILLPLVPAEPARRLDRVARSPACSLGALIFGLAHAPGHRAAWRRRGRGPRRCAGRRHYARVRRGDAGRRRASPSACCGHARAAFVLVVALHGFIDALVEHGAFVDIWCADSLQRALRARLRSQSPSATSRRSASLRDDLRRRRRGRRRCGVSRARRCAPARPTSA